MVSRRFPPTLAPGCARPLYFSKYLPEFGFDPAVLAEAPSRSCATDPSQLDELPESVTVHRVPEHRGRRLDRRHLYLPLIEGGATLVRRFEPDLVWATAPSLDSFKVASVLSRIGGVPLILDYRDPLTYGLLTSGWTEKRARLERAWERRLLEQAARVVFASPLTRERMAARHPGLQTKFTTIPNGFDARGDVEGTAPAREPRGSKMTIRFLGTIYVIGGRCHRNPDVFLDALRILRSERPDVTSLLEVEFVGDCAEVEERVSQRGLSDLVRVRPHVGFAESQRIMSRSDVLLHLQTLDEASKDCIAGKLYEYLAARRPVLGIVTPGGGDDWLLRQCQAGPRIGIDDARAVARAILDLWTKWRADELRVTVDPGWLAQFHRRALTRRLAHLLTEVLEERPETERIVA
jgi:glycosyltransferase involved in cell wall biosynthesis